MITNKVAYSPEETQREIENRNLSQQIAAEAIVLLENDGVLPLNPQKIALYGAGAAMTIRGGSGSGEVNSREEIGICQGLQGVGFTVTTENWLTDYRQEWQTGKEQFLKAAAKSIKGFSPKVLSALMAMEYKYPFGREITEQDITQSDTDTCIFVIARQSGEGKDRSLDSYDYSISPDEHRNLEICAKQYQKTVVILNVGASFDTTFFREIPGLNALVYMSQLGMNGGAALADMLTGKVTPSGKLSETWAKQYSDIPFGAEFSNSGNEADYKEGIFVGYRYFDSFGVAPAYPFGYGLSYTDFSIDGPSVRITDGTVYVKATVRNVGDRYSGKEVLQLYASAPQGKLSKEYQRLVAFGKTKLLNPGEETQMELCVGLEAMASYDQERAVFCLEKGNYLLRMGNSSRNTQAIAVLQLEEEIVISEHRHLCAGDRFVAELTVPSVVSESVSGDIPVYLICTEMLQKKNTPSAENIPKSITSFIKDRTDEELIELVAGTGLFGSDPYFNVPGAVGKTTSQLTKYGISNVLLADGPAGLRLQKRSTITKKGKVKMVDASISLYEMLPRFVQKFLYGNPEKEQMVYQFVTGFPVSHAVAQTWNTELAYKMGEAVSREMTEYGITYWLAPAINLIRNPLCGRNYEYYSEDPVLTGLMAAAVCSGVQKTEGNYVTVKHFACNNQEGNRTSVSSNLEERTFRELYLKCFEIVVKRSRPAAIMAAYNRINGTFCNSNLQLCNEILRGEWGFDGIVMTDWFATADVDRATHWDAIASGVDLIMPGGDGNKKSLKKATKDGRLHREDLERAATRVLNQIVKSQIQKELFPQTFQK